MYVKDQILAVCSKGFETDTLYTLSEIVEEEMPNVKYGILCGPSHAEEVSLQIPTAIVIASKMMMFCIQYKIPLWMNI